MDDYNKIMKRIEKKSSWTAHTDVNKIFDGKILTMQDYLDTESKYIQVCKMFVNFFDCKRVQLLKVETYSKEDVFIKYNDQNFTFHCVSLAYPTIISSLASFLGGR